MSLARRLVGRLGAFNVAAAGSGELRELLSVELDAEQELELSRNDRFVCHRSGSGSEQDEQVMMRVVFVHGACVKDGSW